jgi:SecD/SecF fusion protein
MKTNNWKWVVVALVVAWSLYEMYPPTSRNLVEVFKEEAAAKNASYSNIVERAEALQKEFPGRDYMNLRESIGTNDLRQIFTSYTVPKEATDPNAAILNQLQRKSAGKIKLGLDLRGGTSFLMGVDTTTISTNQDQSAVLSQAVEVLRQRVDKLGVAEPVIQPAGDNRILVQLPGISEAEKETAKRQLERAAFLEFRMVHPKSAELVAQGVIEPGYEKKVEVGKRREGQAPAVVLVKKKSEMTGKYIKSAMASRDPVSGNPEIHFTMDSEGTVLFGKITRENIDQQLAIILDGELYSAPFIRSAIETGSGSISGGSMTIQEAFELANVLENPLEAPVKILEERSVDPSLGKDAIRSGVVASLVGVAGVIAFMTIYYLGAGMVAVVALLLNVLILFGVLCSIGATLTLPGIAGIALTAGMAVDANVLIFERIREELRAGKSVRGALIGGYDKAFGTILDSNLTTLIASVILIYMGTGPVKGFGVTLSIGLVASMFTALVVTRLIFDWLLERNLLKNIKMMNVVPVMNIDFMRLRKVLGGLSCLIVVVGIGYGFYRGTDVLGVDFAGGDTLTLKFAERVPVDKLRDAVTPLGFGEPTIQYQKELATGAENLRITVRGSADKEATDAGAKVEQALLQNFPDAKFTRVGLDKVGATIGVEIQKTAIIASLVALFFILLYVAFRYEFSFAMGAIVAIVHDVLFALGVLFLIGHQLSAPLVAAILTIIGYSINDKIIVFDRIREDLKLGMRGSFMEVINKAINQTLSRTVITGGTTLFATISLYIFGGGAVEDFALVFLIGIVVGTYSSVYVASSFVLWWHKGERPKMASTVSMEQGGATAAAPQA